MTLEAIFSSWKSEPLPGRRRMNSGDPQDSWEPMGKPLRPEAPEPRAKPTAAGEHWSPLPREDAQFAVAGAQ